MYTFLKRFLEHIKFSRSLGCNKKTYEFSKRRHFQEEENTIRTDPIFQKSLTYVIKLLIQSPCMVLIWTENFLIWHTKAKYSTRNIKVKEIYLKNGGFGNWKRYLKKDNMLFRGSIPLTIYQRVLLVYSLKLLKRKSSIKWQQRISHKNLKIFENI